MSYAPYHNAAIPADAGRVMGFFRECDEGNAFEFAARTDADLATFAPDYPNRVFVGNNGESRCARILKTVAYIVVDEADDGSPVVEKWSIKQNRLFA